MLTPAQRIISSAHKNLRQLRGYQPIYEDIVVPIELQGTDVIGVYQGRDGSQIFITINALFIDNISSLIHYDEIANVTIDVSKTSKQDVETIDVILKNGDALTITIKQPTPDNVDVKTQEVWSFYTFLRKAISVIS